jgi:putative long chain acyl-CoA synthase
MLLAHPRGPVDPTASVKRGVFAPADTWVSTEYLFRRDEDGDYWLVDNRGAGDSHGARHGLRRTRQRRRRPARAVDLAVTYGVVVKATSWPHRAGVVSRWQHSVGGSEPRQLADLPGGKPARHRARRCRRVKLSAVLPPLGGRGRPLGIPKPSRNAWVSGSRYRSVQAVDRRGAHRDRRAQQ